MFEPTDNDIGFIGIFLEGFFYGLYSGLFFMYLQYQASKNVTKKTQNIIFYSLCFLYILSAAVFVCDAAKPVMQIAKITKFLRKPISPGWVLPIAYLQSTSFACCDFIAQFILIYRCWIVWGCNTRVVIIPSILALAFLGTWLSYSGSVHISSDQVQTPHWVDLVTLTSLTLSLAVNALVTGMIVFRIFKVFRQVNAAPSEDHIIGATGGSKLRQIIFILIESGMALFSIQLARLVVSILWTDAAYRAFYIITPIHEMLTGITPTIILVRTSMGLSFHDEKSLEESAIESLRFASDNPNLTESIDGFGQYTRDENISVQRSDNVELVESL